MAWQALVLGMGLVASLHAGAQARSPLQAYNVDPATVSVSGMSSGGNMAIQLGVARSSRIMGVAAFAAAPYDCFRPGNITANNCAGQDVPNVDSIALAMAEWSGKQIDAVANLRRQRVYLSVGTKDQVVGLPVVDAAVRLYGLGFVDAANLRLDVTPDAGHVFPSDYDNPYPYRCSYSAGLLANCGIDGAGNALKWIYGTLAPRADVLQGQLIAIDQAEFASRNVGMDEVAWLYVPKDCASGMPCKLHLFLHACNQSYYSRGDKLYPEYSGHARWAETNRIILLFPQTYPTDVVNPGDCWDDRGRYDIEFDHVAGTQIQALMAMIARITSGHVANRSRAVEYSTRSGTTISSPRTPTRSASSIRELSPGGHAPASPLPSKPWAGQERIRCAASSATRPSHRGRRISTR